MLQDFARVGYNILGALSKADYLLPHKSKQKNMLKFSNEGLEHANFLLMRRQFLDRLFQVEITSTMGAQYIYSLHSVFFFNRRYSLLSFGGSQLYNLEALPFTYGQHVVIELADNLYNSVTVCFCASRKYVFQIGFKWEPNMD